MRWLGLALIIFTALGRAGAADWPDKNTATPDLVQTDFGPNGSFLPLDGAEYCAPTAAAMGLLYLANAGFTQIASPNASSEEALNLTAVLGGLMRTRPAGGTDHGPFLAGIQTYLSAKGISAGNYTISHPNDGYYSTLQDIESLNQNQTVVFGLLGWYTEAQDPDYFTRNGGHFFVITDQSSSPASLTIHNPFPHALLNVANAPENVLQTLDVTNISLTPSNNTDGFNGTFLQFDTPKVSQQLNNLGIIEQVFQLTIAENQLPGEGFIPAAWVINELLSLNTGGGNLVVETEVTGTGSFAKEGQGELILTQTVSLTGEHTVEDGALVSTAVSGDVFGGGSIRLEQAGALVLRPDDTTPSAVSLAIASGSNSAVSFDGANEIVLEKHGNTSLTVTLGGHQDGTSPNLVRTQNGTLLIKADDLGNSHKLLVNGSGGNRPALVNGGSMVTAAIVGSDAGGTGRFLTYDETNGFVHAATTGGDINQADADAIFRAAPEDGTQTLTEDRRVYALEIDGVTIGGSAQELAVGADTSDEVAGVIFNGGQISTRALDFGSSQAAIYTGTAGGTISATIEGTSGMVKFGPGALTLSGTGNTYTGDTIFHAGSLIVDAPNATGTATEDHVIVQPHGNVVVSAGGSIAGVVMANDATVTLAGGSIGGANIQGGILQGSGTIASGGLLLNGTIAADPLTGAGTLNIVGDIVTDDGAAFIWSLASLQDANSGGVAGLDWNQLVFGSESAEFDVDVFFDFNGLDDPNSGNAFWNEDHEWLIITLASASAPSTVFSYPNADFLSGSFSHHRVDGGDEVYLRFTAVPEPGVLVLVALGGLALGISRFRRR